jgi:hypothetical protein
MPITRVRVGNYNKWIPAHLRANAAPRKPGPRRPLYWIDSDGTNIYFINNTDETLTAVSTMTNGYITCDDDVLAVTGEDFIYENVQPNEAVKLDDYDPIYDADFSLQLSLNIISAKHGNLHFLYFIDMNNCRNKVLVWNTGEKGKYVSMNGQINVEFVAVQR